MRKLSTASRLPPGPKPLPLVGNLVDFLRHGPDLFENSARTFGDLTTVYLGDRQHFVINDPTLIQNILVRDRKNFEKGRALGLARRTLGSGLLTSDGEIYRKQRRVAQPAFSMKNMSDFFGSVTLFMDQLQARWTDGFEFDVSDEMAELCIKIAAHSFLGVDVSHSAHRINKTFDDTLSALNQLNLLPPVAERLPLPLNFRVKRLRRQLGAIADEIIEQRNASKGRATDLLSLALAGAEGGEDGKLTDQELREQVITFLFAGYEAPCKVLTWTWYLLAKDAARAGTEASDQDSIVQKLRDEVDGVLGGRPPELSDVPNLPYTKAVVSEVMRLYPPVWIVARKILEPYTAGDFTLPAGAEVFMSPYIIQRDPRYFPNPLAFDPGRWLDKAQQDRPQFSYFPFGGGLRGCAGAHFAWPELILIVASIAQHWEMSLTTGGDVKPNPAFTFGPSSAIRLRATRRANALAPAELERMAS